MNKTLNNNLIAIDKTTNIVYNTDMISNDNNNEREIQMIQEPTNEELEAIEAYEQHEANWEELESDDGHQELYEDQGLTYTGVQYII